MTTEQSKPTLAEELRNMLYCVETLQRHELEELLIRHESQSALQQLADQAKALDMGHGKPGELHTEWMWLAWQSRVALGKEKS